MKRAFATVAGLLVIFGVYTHTRYTIDVMKAHDEAMRVRAEMIRDMVRAARRSSDA